MDFSRFFGKKKVYLDFASATPVLPEVRREMDKYWSRDFYNPSSIYDEGVRMKKELESIRARVARALGAGKKNVIFTSGATESDNMAIFGIHEAFRERYPHKMGHLIVSAIDHPSILEPAEELRRRGVRVSVVSVDKDGFINIKELEKLIRKDTFLISVGFANGELGTLEPVSRIGRLVKEKRREFDSDFPYFHTDASQAPNFFPVNIENLQADLLTLDSSKVYGPKGVGLLAVRAGVPSRPIMWGGGQEQGLRPGTENLGLIAGFARALEIAERDRDAERIRLCSLREYFIQEIRKNLSEAIVNGPERDVLPNITSVSFPGASAEMLLLALDSEGVMVSQGSACSSNSDEPGSYVIRAIGKPELAESTLRFSFGRTTERSDIDKALEILYRRVPCAKISL